VRITSINQAQERQAVSHRGEGAPKAIGLAKGLLPGPSSKPGAHLANQLDHANRRSTGPEHLATDVRQQPEPGKLPPAQRPKLTAGIDVARPEIWPMQINHR